MNFVCKLLLANSVKATVRTSTYVRIHFNGTLVYYVGVQDQGATSLSNAKPSSSLARGIGSTKMPAKLDPEKLGSLTVAVLKTHCTSNGLLTTGKKVHEFLHLTIRHSRLKEKQPLPHPLHRNAFAPVPGLYWDQPNWSASVLPYAMRGLFFRPIWWLD